MMGTFGAVLEDDMLSGEKLETTVKRAVKGDVEALNELCRGISRQVLFTATYLLGEAEGSEDIAQESLIDLCRGIHTLQEPKAFKNWMNTIILNNKNKYLNERIKRGVVVDINEWLEELVEERNSFIPGADLESAEMRNVVKRIIMDLPVRQREAIVMQYYNNLTQKEIADAMGVSFQCVSQYLVLARKKVKRDVETYLSTEKPNNSPKKHAIVPLTALIEGVLHYDAQLMGYANEAVIQKMVAACSEYIASSAAAAATAATAASASASAAEIGSVAAVTAISTFKSALICGACAIVLTVGVTVGLLIADSNSQQQTLREIPSLAITLEGGVRADEGMAMVNPTNAYIAEEDVSVLYWWIVERGSEQTIAQGEGDTVSVGLSETLQSGNQGIHILTIRAQSEGFTPHTAFISFYNFPAES